MPAPSSLPWLVAAACLLTMPAPAEAMSCGRRLVSEGDSLYDVRSRCGVPDMTQQRVEYRTVRTHIAGPCFKEQGQLRCGQQVLQTIAVVIDEWTYDFGPHQFVRTLLFEQGVVRAIVTGHYGTKQAAE